MPPEAKSDKRRKDILDRLADHVLAHGLSASSLRALGKAAKTSDRMLLYYFADKDEIIVATLGVIGERLEAILRERVSGEPLPVEELRPLLVEAVMDKALWPYMRMWLEISALAAHGNTFYQAVGQQLAQRFLDWGAEQLKSTSPEARATEAAGLLLTIEGVLLLNSVGMDSAIKAALRPA